MVKALGHRLHVKRVLDETKVGSIVLVGTCRDMNPLFDVLSVGEDVEGVKAGDRIVCGRYAGEEVKEHEYLIKDEDVLCVVQDD